MTKPSQADIDTVLTERFPLRYMYEAAASIEGMQKRDGNAAPAKSTEPSPSALKAEVDAYRAHLESLPAPEVAKLAAKSRERLAAKAAAERAKKEAARFYNQPSAQADFEFWCKADYWTADEAAALLLGKDPRVVNPDALTAELTKPTGFLSLGKSPARSDFHKQYEGLRTFLLRASGLQGSALTPRAALEWAEHMKVVVVPAALATTATATVTGTANATDTATITAAAAVRSSTGAKSAVVDATGSLGNTPARTGGTEPRWSREELEKLRKFRDQHGAKAAAAEFGVTRQRVEALLKKDQPPKSQRGYSAFTHRS